MLIISDSDEEVLLRTRRMLYAAGIMTITLPYTELLTVKFDETVYGLILEDPYDSHLPESFVYTFRRRNPNIPVIMFKQPFKDDCNSLWNADALIDSSLPSGKLVDELLLTLSRYHHRDVALFLLGTARDHLLDDAPTFNSITIHMTPIERNIFRHLIVAAYHPVSAKELQRYCTKPGTSPTIGNIASHVYRINLKAYRALGYHIILSDSGGYRLLTEEEVRSRPF